MTGNETGNWALSTTAFADKMQTNCRSTSTVFDLMNTLDQWVVPNWAGLLTFREKSSLVSLKSFLHLLKVHNTQSGNFSFSRDVNH